MKIKAHCFGKLPAYQDFVICECTTPLATVYRKWLENSFNSNNDKGDRLKEEYYAIMLASDEYKEGLVGLIRDSHDHGGLRRFPFSVFLTVPSKAIKKAAAGNSAMALTPVWEEVGSVDNEVMEAENLSVVHECFKRWKPEFVKPNKKNEPLLHHESLEYNLKTLVDNLGGPDGNSTWNRVMWGVKQLSNVELDWLTKGGVTWPLINDLDTGFQMDMWALLLNRQRELMGKPPLPELYSMVFPTSVKELSFGAMIFRSLITEDQALFCSQEEPPQGVIDLSGRQPPLTLDGFYAFQCELKDALHSADLKIKDLFELDMVTSDRISRTSCPIQRRRIFCSLLRPCRNGVMTWRG